MHTDIYNLKTKKRLDKLSSQHSANSSYLSPCSSLLNKQKGVALIVVLWMVSIMLMIGSAMLYSVKTDSTMTAYTKTSAQASSYADAALRYAVAQLMLPKQIRELKTTGSPYAWQYDGMTAEISVIGENGLVDINSATRTLLQKVFEQIGIVDDEAETLIDAIQDFKDKDDLKRLNGAEDRDYEAAGFLYGSKDAPFERIEELQQVMGITASIYNRLSKYLTVSSQGKGINPMLAPRHILMLLADGDAAAVNDYITQREESEGEYVHPPFGDGFIDRNQQPRYRVQIRVKMEEGAPEYFEERSIRLVAGKLPPFISYFRVMQKLDKKFL